MKHFKRILALTLALTVICALAPAAAAKTAESSFGGYKHVFIIGIDGAGTFFEKDYMKNFHRIFKDGAVKYGVRTETKTDSGPNWNAILTGVSYFKTGAENGVVSLEQDRVFRRYPTVFKYVRDAMPDAELASFSNWGAINKGIVEDDIGVTKVTQSPDDALTDSIVEYFEKGNRPALFFVQLDEVDGAGHGHGSASAEYENALKQADERVGRIYEAVEKAGLMEDGLFIVTADHGHRPEGGHGRFSKIESYSTIALKGKTVKKGGALDSDTKLRDIAAISLYALGVKSTEWNFSAKVPADCFEDFSGQTRPFYRDIIDTICGAFMWAYTNLGAPLDKYF
ncbi:MAG: alkaline phosphatase [Clostridia bacterium]|nr:alkaline phosphatase [Clostridia bacterium]